MTDTGPQAAEVHFASRLREYREAIGMTQEALATAMRDTGFAHVRQQTIDRMERGRQRPRLGEFLALAEILGVDAQRLLRPDGITRAGLRIRLALRDTRGAERAIARGRDDLAAARERLFHAAAAAQEQGLADVLAEEISLARIALRDTEDLT